MVDFKKSSFIVDVNTRKKVYTVYIYYVRTYVVHTQIQCVRSVCFFILLMYMFDCKCECELYQHVCLLFAAASKSFPHRDENDNLNTSP